MKNIKNQPQTELIQPDFETPRFNALATPVRRASTVVFDSVNALRERNWRDPTQYTYGLLGTPTTRKLSQQLARIDGVEHCLLAPSGLGAISLVLLSLLTRDDVVYLPNNAYFPALEVCRWLSAEHGIVFKRYDPMHLATLVLAEQTKLVWVETPGSVTMEVADLPKIAALAHAKNALVAVDATWAAGLALPVFKLGADISIQALTKYQSGGSDVMMGSVSTNDQAIFDTLWQTMVTLGNGVSPDDCEVVLRSLPHMALRYVAQDKVAREIAQWCQTQPAIEAVLHPALPGSPGHTVWRRDFSGAASLFSIVFNAEIAQTEIDKVVDALQLFRIGFSWGGAVSLAVPFKASELHTGYAYKGGLVRLYIGLEAKEDLLNDLSQAFEMLNKPLN